MTQYEMKEFFEWVQRNLRNFEIEECEESTHFYLNEALIGGIAGDCQSYFIQSNDEVSKALRMMDAAETLA